jgi:hypothetical protein
VDASPALFPVKLRNEQKERAAAVKARLAADARAAGAPTVAAPAAREARVPEDSEDEGDGEEPAGGQEVDEASDVDMEDAESEAEDHSSDRVHAVLAARKVRTDSNGFIVKLLCNWGPAYAAPEDHTWEEASAFEKGSATRPGPLYDCVGAYTTFADSFTPRWQQSQTTLAQPTLSTMLTSAPVHNSLAHFPPP